MRRSNARFFAVAFGNETDDAEFKTIPFRRVPAKKIHARFNLSGLAFLLDPYRFYAIIKQYTICV